MEHSFGDFLKTSIIVIDIELSDNLEPSVFFLLLSFHSLFGSITNSLMRRRDSGVVFFFWILRTFFDEGL